MKERLSTGRIPTQLGVTTPSTPSTRGHAGGYTMALTQGGVSDSAQTSGGSNNAGLSSGGTADE